MNDTMTIPTNNNPLLKTVKTVYNLLTDREQAIYQAGYSAGMKSNEKPFKFVPDVTPINSADVFQKIKIKVCSYFKISQEELFAKARNQYLVIPRSIAINLTRELSGFSYPQIAVITDRDHTSLIYHVSLRINKKGIWKIPNNHAVYNLLKKELMNEKE